MGKKVLFIVAHENFRDEELFHTKEELVRAGAAVTIASTSKGTANGMLGGSANVDITINEAGTDYDAIVFIGGGGSSVYFNNTKAHELAKAYAKAGKPVAAICIAPITLYNAGLLTGKNYTMWTADGKAPTGMGSAKFTGKAVEIDGNIITANGPAAAREFGKAIARKFKG